MKTIYTMKRFKTRKQLSKALNKLGNHEIIKNSNDPRTWYYVSVKPFKEVFYYLTEEEIKKHETKKTN